MTYIEELKNKVLAGTDISHNEALSLCDIDTSMQTVLWDAAQEITAELCDKTFDSCSIINARSGKCPENCKWCAQSAHYKTDISTYPLVSHDECMPVADMNRDPGIHRISHVASRRKMAGKELDTV